MASPDHPSPDLRRAPGTKALDPIASDLVAGVSGGLVMIDPAGVVVARNDEAVRLLGAPEPGANLWAVTSDGLVGLLRSTVHVALERGARYEAPEHARCGDVLCRVAATPVRGGFVVHVLDVTEHVRAAARAQELEADARRRDEDLDALLASWGMRVSYVDEELRYTRVFNVPMAYPEGHYVGKRAYEFADTAEVRVVADFQREVLASGQSLRRECSFHDGRGVRTWLLYGEPIRAVDGRTEGVKTVAFDVTGTRKAEVEASTDYLTGVANRRAMEARVQHEASRSTRYGTVASVIALDIDRFKDVNDAFGHARGDEVLKELVGRLGEELRDADVLARWGGEEFLVLLPETANEEARRVAERMRQRVAAEPFDVVGGITISSGVATTTPGEGADGLLERADAACLYAKRLGRDRVVAVATGHDPVAARGQPRSDVTLDDRTCTSPS